MRGKADFNFPAFDAAASALRAAYWKVFNPADNDRERERPSSPTGDPSVALPLKVYMALDLSQVCQSDAIFMLPGWEDSEGASLEFNVAQYLKIPVYDWESGGRITVIESQADGLLLGIDHDDLEGERGGEPPEAWVNQGQSDEERFGIHEDTGDVTDFVFGRTCPSPEGCDSCPNPVTCADLRSEAFDPDPDPEDTSNIIAGMKAREAYEAMKAAYGDLGKTPPPLDLAALEDWVKTMPREGTYIVEPDGTFTPIDPDKVTQALLDGEMIEEHHHFPLGTKPTNPKDIVGSSKLPLHLWPSSATALGCLALLDGALKYGRSNWREAGVKYSIYHDAAKRHLDACFEGQWFDPDSGLPHLAHALACIAIVVDAKAADNLVDDRQYRGEGYLRYVQELTPEVERLKAKHAGRDLPKHYTIGDEWDRPYGEEK